MCSDADLYQSLGPTRTIFPYGIPAAYELVHGQPFCLNRVIPTVPPRFPKISQIPFGYAQANFPHADLKSGRCAANCVRRSKLDFL